ncbi:MAG: choice-of-anchor V domain-containing protein [Ignavibacteriales bacterium]
MNSVKRRYFYYSIYILTFAFVIFYSIRVYAYPSGVSGYTKKSGTLGCGSCHGTHSDPNSQVSVEIKGPATLKTGATGDYSVTITGGVTQVAGVDIAASAGTLANTDNNLKLSNSELTHNSAKSFSGSYTFNFKYTAPSTAGTQTLYATGLSSKTYWNFAPNFTVGVQTATDVEDKSKSPDIYSLEQNFPNPFNPSSLIRFSLAKESNVKLAVFNSIGEKVKDLVNGVLQTGNHEINFSGINLSSGIYFYKIDAVALDGSESFRSVKKMLLMK